MLFSTHHTIHLFLCVCVCCVCASLMKLTALFISLSFYYKNFEIIQRRTVPSQRRPTKTVVWFDFLVFSPSGPPHPCATVLFQMTNFCLFFFILRIIVSVSYFEIFHFSIKNIKYTISLLKLIFFIAFASSKLFLIVYLLSKLPIYPSIL